MLGKLCFKKANSVLLRRAAVSTFPSAFPCLSTRFALRQAIATSAHNFYSSRVPNNEHTTTEQLEPETVVEQEQQETEYISNELVVEIRTADVRLLLSFTIRISHNYMHFSHFTFRTFHTFHIHSTFFRSSQNTCNALQTVWLSWIAMQSRHIC